MDIKNKNIFQILENIKGSEINKKYFLDSLNDLDLKKINEYGENELMYIIYCNKFKKLSFYKEDIIYLMDKFNLKQQNVIG